MTTHQTLLAIVVMTTVNLGAQDRPPAGPPDWLLVPVTTPSRVEASADGKELALDNGLLRRTFRTTPNYATVGLKHLGNGAEFLRAVGPEAVITIGGERWEIGGLQGQPDRGYLEPAWLARMTASTNAFRYAGHRLGQPEARYPWKPRYGAAPVPWPPKGVRLTVDFQPPLASAPSNSLAGVAISLHYEIYDGLPALAKWLTISNGGSAAITVDKLEVENLAVAADQRLRLMVECDQVHSGAPSWGRDPNWPTFVPLNPGDTRFLTYPQEFLLRCEYVPGPATLLGAGEDLRVLPHIRVASGQR